MLKLIVLPFDQEIKLFEGETVRDALYRHNIELESPCNGKGKCGKCGVWVRNPRDVPETPHKNITKKQAEQGLRLACQLRPQKSLVIELPQDFSKDAGRILESRHVLGEEDTWYRVAPAARVIEKSNRFWLQYAQIEEVVELTNWQEEFSPKGLAIDLGTTTMVVSLLCLKSGKELATASSLNPQVKYGHDVLSRIQHGSTSQGLSELFEVVREGLNRLIAQTCKDANSDPQEVLDVVVGGNTTMLQLLAAIDPAPLGKVPFTVGIKGGQSYPIEQFGLKINPKGRLYVPPVAHAFIGSDISAGLLVSSGFFDNDQSIMFIDVGTNGEMGLSSNGKRVMTSTAAGPAFEGMGLSSGMRAAIGAVEYVTTDGEKIEYETIGNEKPRGICGSGIMDLLTCLLRLEVIDSTGRMLHPSEKEKLPQAVGEHLEELDGKPAFRIGEDVYFTQDDIRQVQLAKAAIRAAMEMLMEEIGSSVSKLEKIIVAGGFGHSLRPESLESIGMIPPGAGVKISFIGNSSRIGSEWLLIDSSYRRFLEEKMTSVQHVPIAERMEFMDRFVESMEFPEHGRT